LPETIIDEIEDPRSWENENFPRAANSNAFKSSDEEDLEAWAEKVICHQESASED
jgi:hypothetical protein